MTESLIDRGIFSKAWQGTHWHERPNKEDVTDFLENYLTAMEDASTRKDEGDLPVSLEHSDASKLKSPKCKHYNATMSGICNDCGRHWTEAFR